MFTILKANDFKQSISLWQIAIIALLVFKTIIGFWNAQVDLSAMRTHFGWQTKQTYLEGINIDEYEMARTAYFYLHEGRFISDNHFGRPNFTNSTYQISAFRPKFNIWLHIVGLRLYEKYTHTTIQTAYKIPMAYFGYYCFWLAVFKSIFFAISVWFFYQLASLIFDKQDQWASISTIAYICYPSVLWYMGWLDILENIGMPLLVIVLTTIVLGFEQAKYRSKLVNIGIGFIAALACLARPHLISVFQMLLFGYIAFSTWHYYKHKKIPHNWQQIAVLYACIVLGHTPIFVQNYHDFGKVLLSTQPGLEFFQGHNPFARGTWNPYLWEQHQDDFAQIFNDPELKFYNEKQELDFYFKQALYWIKEHPTDELWLMIRKTAIYFFPFNYLNQSINWIMVLTHLGFATFVSFAVFSKPWRKKLLPNTQKVFLWTVVFAPIVACYAISMVFFVCERWRFYAEPFMLLCAIYFYQQIWQNYKNKKLVPSNVQKNTLNIPTKTPLFVDK
jgi:hypothetical protein